MTAGSSVITAIGGRVVPGDALLGTLDVSLLSPSVTACLSRALYQDPHKKSAQNTNHDLASIFSFPLRSVVDSARAH